MVTTALQEDRTTEPPDSASSERFDPIASRDLELLERADGHLRQAWKDLTRPARRSAVATGCILELACMLADLHGERRKIEEAAQI